MQVADTLYEQWKLSGRAKHGPCEILVVAGVVYRTEPLNACDVDDGYNGGNKWLCLVCARKQGYIW